MEENGVEMYGVPTAGERSTVWEYDESRLERALQNAFD